MTGDVFRGPRWAKLSTAVAAAIVGVGIVPGIVGPQRVATASGAPPTISVLSNRADLVSGGDALVELGLPAGTGLGSAKVDVDGRDITAAFAKRSTGKVQALVTGLKVGDNLVRVRLGDGTGATITITNDANRRTSVRRPADPTMGVRRGRGRQAVQSCTDHRVPLQVDWRGDARRRTTRPHRPAMWP